MGLTQKLGTIPLAILTDSSNNVGIGGSANASFKLQVTGATNLTGALSGTSATFSSSVTAGGKIFTSASVNDNILEVINSDTTNGYGLYVRGGGTATNRYVARFKNGADNDVMLITSGGNVGIGTSSPNVSSQGANNTLMTIQGQSGSYGMLEIGATTNTAESLIGVLGFTSTNVTGGLLGFISMAAEGTTGTNVGGRIQFNTKANGGGITERMRITSGGNVGIGTSSPNYPISVKQNVNANAVIYGINEFTSGWGVYIQKKSSDTGGYFFVGDNQTANKILIYGTGNVENTNGSYGTIASDRRLKENIVDATSKLEDILKLRVVNFNLIGETQKNIGFIAQEMQDVFPSLVNIKDTRKYDEDGNIISGYEDALGLKVGMEFAILVKAIQELKAEINELKNK